MPMFLRSPKKRGAVDTVWFRSVYRGRVEASMCWEKQEASQSRRPANDRTVCLDPFCVARTEHRLDHL